MNEMNPVIKWGLDALIEGVGKLPDNENVQLAFQLAGLPIEEIKAGTLPLGEEVIQTIFSEIYKTSQKIEKMWINLQFLDPTIMPVPVEEKLKGTPDLSKLIRDISKNEIEAAQSNESMALAFIEKYGSYVAISKMMPYLSVYDTVKNASALYTCLQKSDRIRLIGGDLSGIQSYLFNMSESNSKGVAKILRARSFYLSLFCDVCKHYLLHSLELPLFNTLIDAGGRFTVIAPETEGLFDKIKLIQKNIDLFCLRKFYGELNLNLGISESVLTKTLNSDVLQEQLEVLNFNLENQKMHAFADQLIQGNWQAEQFVFGQEYDKYANDVCPISGKLPKSSKSKDAYSKEFEDHKKLGQELVRKTYLVYSNKDIKEKDLLLKFVFDSTVYSIQFTDQLPDNHSDLYYQIENLKGNFAPPATPRYFDNYVPRFPDSFDVNDDIYRPFEHIPDFSIRLDKSDIQDKPKPGNIMDFGTIANAGAHHNEKDENGNKEIFYGSDLLGLVKADVDNMGQLFTTGLKEAFSVTTYTTLSRQLNLFFTAYLAGIQQKDYPFMYTIYTGGDDLLFIGEWEQAIKFAKEVYDSFRSFTGNPSITLSSAVYVMHSRHPIRTAANAGEELLSKAKGNGRDSFAVFNSVVKQEKLDELFKFAEFLDKKRKEPNEKSKINSGFLHRLLHYMRMAKSFEDGEDYNGIMYKPLLSYDVGRNIVERDKEGKMTKGEEEYKKFQDLTDQSYVKNHGFVQLPIHYAILKNRKLNLK